MERIKRLYLLRKSLKVKIMKKFNKSSSEGQEKRKFMDKKIFKFVILPLVVFAIIGAFVNSNETESSPTNTNQQEHVDMIKALFSAYDGSCYCVEKYIKEHLNDADSYEHVKTEYAIQKDDKILVRTTYRGSNALGAKVINTNRFLIDLKGNVLSVE